MPFGAQGFVDALVALALALGGFVLKGLRDEQTALTRKHDALVDTLPNVYARRDDVRADLDDIKTIMRRIEDKIDARPR